MMSHAPISKAHATRDSVGSRARCVQLTQGSPEVVAANLAKLTNGLAEIDPHRDFWMPRNGQLLEARLRTAYKLLSEEKRSTLTRWWLAVPERANTPNWDIASTAKIDGVKGLLLVEAKAYTSELAKSGKPHWRRAKGLDDNEAARSREAHERNAAQIQEACRQASAALNDILPGDWNLSTKSHYQLRNRFAWSWKLASLGVPVVLVYLGFLNANEMTPPGNTFSSLEDWKACMETHAAGTVPNKAWGATLKINAAMRALLCVREVELPVPDGQLVYSQKNA